MMLAMHKLSAWLEPNPQMCTHMGMVRYLSSRMPAT